MIRFVAIVFAAALAFHPVPGRAATLLGFEEAVLETASGNAELRAAREALVQSEALAESGRSGYFPVLSAHADWDRVDAASTATQETFGSGLSVSQNIFAGFRDEATAAQAARRFDAQSEALRQVKARVSADLRNAFAGLAVSREGLGLAERTLARREENDRLVRLRYESGRENQGSHLKAQADVGRARVGVIEASHRILTARERLARTLGRSTGAGLDIVGSAPVNDVSDSPDLAALVERAPEVRQARHNEEAAAEVVRVARSDFYPSVDLSATAGRAGTTWWNGGRVNGVGLSVTVPIFSGGSTLSQTRAAVADYERLRALRVDAEQAARVRIQEAHARLVQAVAALRAAENTFEAERVRSEIARARYSTGLLSFENWNQIELEFTQAERALLDARLERVAAESAFDQGVGKGVIP